MTRLLLVLAVAAFLLVMVVFPAFAESSYQNTGNIGNNNNSGNISGGMNSGGGDYGGGPVYGGGLGEGYMIYPEIPSFYYSYCPWWIC